MFSHVMVGTNDIEKARAFYDKLFSAVGGRPGIQDERGRLIYLYNKGIFMVSVPINGEPACFANGGTIGFAFDNPDLIDKWHAAGVEAGGTSIEEPPGIREADFGKLYLAYIRDPDGNKLCAMHRMTPANVKGN